MIKIQGRLSPRISLRIPVEIQLQGKLKGQKEACIADNISAHGIYFVTALPLVVGALISMIFVMPQELAERLSNPFRYTGVVLRVQRVGGPDKKYGVAVNLLWLTEIGARTSDMNSDNSECTNAA